MPDQVDDAAEYRRGRGMDYLGSMGRMLRDLSGSATLVYELLQNADDATDATAVRFDVTPEALVVWNDGRFSDCGKQDLHPDDCPWLGQQGERCDFHRFRSVSAGDKGRRADLTGAFGIGFTAVYQITDQPEVISSGRHWFIDETQEEANRIREHGRCQVCDGETGTRFILPWARDPNSEFRRRTNAPAIDDRAPAELAEVLDRVVPTAMLFLRRIRSVNLLVNSKSRRELMRVDDREDTLISDGQVEQLWRVVPGDFESEADELRLRYPGKIEKSSEVSVAIPYGIDLEGLLCAYLPTDERTGLPFHVNADFFPLSDRKRLVAEGYAGEWNRAAVRMAARVVADRLLDLRDVCQARQLWSLLVAAHQAAMSPTIQSRDLDLDAFWEFLEPELRTAPILLTSENKWAAPEVAHVVRDHEEEEAAQVLSLLGGVFAHPDLREFLFRLPYDRALGLSQFRLSTLVDLLIENGLDRRRDVADLPRPLQPPDARELMLRELELLLSRAPEESKRQSEAIGRVALAPGMDAALWPWADTYRADQRTQDLFEAFAEGSVFLDEKQLPSDALHVAVLSPAFRAPDAISWLSARGDEEIGQLLRDGRVDVTELLEWFESHKSEFIDDADLAAELVEVACFPTSTGFRPLSELALPGDFQDDLGLADIVDVVKVGDALPLLKKLGARPLTFASYVAEFVPRAVDLSTSDPDRWWKLVLRVAEKLGQIEDDPEVRRVLGELPCVRTTAAHFSKPSDVYFESELVGKLLGDYPKASLPRVRPRSVEAFYLWVGVATKPRQGDILEQVRRLAAVEPTRPARTVITSVVEYLAAELPKRRQEWGQLALLAGMKWLPAREDASRWFEPKELYATFQDYLFSSQARFIGIPLSIQRGAASLLDELGVRRAPSMEQIVAHLLHCSESGASMNQEVYAALNDRVEDPAIARLAGRRSILLPSGAWVPPTFVFWGAHPFGRFRATLGGDFQRFAPLLSRLGVREHPDHVDAAAVLLEMATEFGGSNNPVEDDNDLRVYVACWRMLGDALDAEVVAPEGFAPFKARKVIRDARGVLVAPDRVLFDDVPGVADMFPVELRTYLIRRPEGAWRAMRAAGVRDLSRAVATHMLELGERGENVPLHSMIRARAAHIGRVLDPSDPTWAGRLGETIERLRVISSSRLRVEYSLRDFGLLAAPADLEALFVPDDLALYVVPAKDQNWLVIARELARAIAPDAAPGSLAANLALILAAADGEAAERQLDQAGVPRLEQSPEGTAEATVVEAFGGDKGPTEDQRELLWPESAPAVASGAVSASGEPSAGDLLAHGEPHEGAGDSSSTSGDGRAAVGESRGKGPRSRLRSYVIPAGETAAEGDEDAVEAAGDSEVDHAGVARVLKFELDSGRTPVEKPHNFPGYDIESLGEDGNVERYIEVKSLAGAWDAYGVSVSPKQFSEARRLGTRYWLYVVAGAERSDFSIHCVQDPAAKVDQFMFDEDWIRIGETSAGGRPILSLHLSQGDARLPDRRYLPFYEIPAQEPGSAGAEAGWLEWEGDASPGSYLVQVLGDALSPLARRGTVVLVEPLGAGTPAAGEPLLLDLGGQRDPETGTDLAFRTWPADGGPRDDAPLELPSTNPATPPLVIEDGQLVRILGRVRADWAKPPRGLG
jgi:hypothetical protein